MEAKKFTFRINMGMAMLFVVPAAAASALFAKLYQHIPTPASLPYIRIDAPILFVTSIITTAVALGALKAHSAVHMMIQVTLACVGYVALLTLGESGRERPLLYWFQCGFALYVTLPMIARALIKSRMERGPRRDWWKKTCEAGIFAFLTMLLVLVGLLLQFLMVYIGQIGILKF